MATKPLFSILLPTKNRAHLVGYAIQSVLNQDFGDFELIIADNDDTDATSKVVSQFDDERIRYIRTGGLDMVQNWNASLSEARGEYVLLLEDKFVFYRRAFSILFDYLRVHEASTVVWRCDVIDDSQGLHYRPVVPFKSRIANSNDVLEIFLRKRMRVWDTLPRGLCTAVRRKVVNDCIKNFSAPFYDYFSPDLVSALKILKTTEKIHYLNANLNCMISSISSNGRLVRQLKDDGSYFGMDLAKVSLQVPVQCKYLVANMVAHDIEAVLNDGGPPFFARYKRAYFSSLFRELGVGLGEGIHYPRQDIKALFIANGMDLIPYFSFLDGYIRSCVRLQRRKIHGNTEDSDKDRMIRDVLNRSMECA